MSSLTWWQREQEAERTRKNLARQRLAVGVAVLYAPRADKPRAGQEATVVRAPRPDVKNASVRLTFADGEQLTVPAHHVRLPTGEVFRDRREVPELPLVEDARSRPAWKRLVREVVAALDDHAERFAETDDDDQDARLAETDDLPALNLTAATQRARQLAAIVDPHGTQSREQLGNLILQAAQVQAEDERSRRAGHVRRPVLERPDPVRTLDTSRLSAGQRSFINNIARCLHRRYFLSDREQPQRLVNPGVEYLVRETAKRWGAVNPVKTAKQGRASEDAARVRETTGLTWADALEACQRLVAGRVDDATLLASRALEHYAVYKESVAALTRDAPEIHTGRWFHGDVLSVREKEKDGGMMQYYARVTFVWSEDGHTVVVANATELEALAGASVGPDAWRDLCRWLLDTSERQEGRLQGRRQEDDTTLIYREHRGLELRENLRVAYPGLMRAFECLRRALINNEIPASEIPEDHPAPGYHPPAKRPEKVGGLDKTVP